MAGSNKLVQADHEPDWQIDDLQESELDRILSLEGQNNCTDAAFRHQSSTRNPSFAHTWEWAIKLATKRDQERRSFFDLPAEIRMTIYDFYKTSLLRDFDLTDKRWPVHLFNFRADYLARILRPQLVCHQLRSELMPFWTRDMALLLSYVSFTMRIEHMDARLSQLRGTWLHVRRLLGWVGPVARHDIHTIRICYIYRFSELLRWHNHLQILEDRTALDLVGSFERLADVHEELKVEVELRCDGSNDLPFLPTRRVVTFQQLPFGRRNGPDWTYCCGEIEEMKINPYFGHLNEVHGRPHFKHCRDEVWVTSNES